MTLAPKHGRARHVVVGAVRRHLVHVDLAHAPVYLDAGGEASGHIICGEQTTTGDGIIAALQVMAAVVRSGETLLTLKSGLHKYPQTLLNVTVSPDFLLAECAAALDESRRVEEVLSGRGRLVLRPSGTEPLIRVMIEGTDGSENLMLAERIAQTIRDAH